VYCIRCDDRWRRSSARDRADANTDRWRRAQIHDELHRLADLAPNTTDPHYRAPLLQLADRMNASARARGVDFHQDGHTSGPDIATLRSVDADLQRLLAGATCQKIISGINGLRTEIAHTLGAPTPAIQGGGGPASAGASALGQADVGAIAGVLSQLVEVLNQLVRLLQSRP
jgi:hypothetical protein